jgi:U3 small nucleolar RNA-associated protein 14
VPHGYESKAQFERTMRMGLGKEWNTATVFQKRVKPRIVTKPGQVILPMK